ncbi:MAG: tRNA pseudouridine(38-40) synthase TruA [Pseudomonadales bacterium]|nr:tRNA pseudouridine(38-40) synthase TruA [Pseudomonadales bacterium]
MRIALGIEYDGSHYCGWQAQKHTPNTVQAVLEPALSFVANHPVKLICAGRTDTGVHATQQVAHFETDSLRDNKAWVMGATTKLPRDVCIRWAKVVPTEFHARFSAQTRSYRYLIYNSPVRQALLSTQMTWSYRPLDLDRMKVAGAHLVGEHDFSSYQAVACQAKSAVRHVHHLKLSKVGDIIILDIKANAFLQHMVRNVVGVLMSIGCGDHPVDWAKEVLNQRDRTKGGVTAPPFGLYFVGVEYPEEFSIPEASLKIPVMPFFQE